MALGRSIRDTLFRPGSWVGSQLRKVKCRKCRGIHVSRSNLLASVEAPRHVHTYTRVQCSANYRSTAVLSTAIPALLCVFVSRFSNRIVYQRYRVIA